MNALIMPKATAVWLLDNTTLTFEQIAAFCNLHILEVQAIADGEVAVGIIGINPVAHNQLTEEELQKGMKDPAYHLKHRKNEEVGVKRERTSSRYTPIARRQDKPDAITWLVRHHPELSDAQIITLIGTTKTTIDNIRQRRHWNVQQIKPRDPIELGLCTQQQLNEAIEKAHKRQDASQAAALNPKKVSAPKKAAPKKTTTASKKAKPTKKK
jgi:hypothetical protein